MVLALAASFPGRYGIQQPCFRRWQRGNKQQDSILLFNMLRNSSHHSHVIQWKLEIMQMLRCIIIGFLRWCIVIFPSSQCIPLCVILRTRSRRDLLRQTALGFRLFADFTYWGFLRLKSGTFYLYFWDVCRKERKGSVENVLRKWTIRSR